MSKADRSKAVETDAETPETPEIPEKTETEEKPTTPVPGKFTPMQHYKWLLTLQHNYRTVKGRRCDGIDLTAAFENEEVAVVWCKNCGVVLDRKKRSGDD